MAQETYFNIKLFDNDACSALSCSCPVSDAVVYKISRDYLSQLKSEEKLNQSGIYFLFGEENGKRTVYIGQGIIRKNKNGVLSRVKEHNRMSENYWDTALIVVSQKDSVSATELNYLENQCCNRAIDAGRYTVVNKTDPTIGKYSDQTKYVMDIFIDDFSKVLNMFGYNVFTPVVEEKTDKISDIYFIKRDSDDAGRRCDIKCAIIDDKYTLLSGGQICTVPTNSCPISIKKQRLENKEIVDKNGILLEDKEFDTPSGATRFALYASSNGLIDLKNTDGISLKEVLNNKQKA